MWHKLLNGRRAGRLLFKSSSVLTGCNDSYSNQSFEKILLDSVYIYVQKRDKPSWKSLSTILLFFNAKQRSEIYIK